MFESLEQHVGNILVCSEAYPEWCSQCLLSADLVIVATEFSANPNRYAIEKTLDLYTRNILNKKIYIVFLHENTPLLPTQTSHWLSKRA